MSTFALLEAPSNLGLSAPGVERLPDRFRELGFGARIGAREAGRVAPSQVERRRDPATTILNGPAIAEWTPLLAGAVGALLDGGERPLVLGGDCTILLGSLLALRQRGRYGLLFLDGHADFFQPEAEPNGEGASMELAWATGHGPDLVSQYNGAAPLVRSSDVVAFGFRDHADQAEYHAQPLPGDMLVLDLPFIRQHGMDAAVHQAVLRLTRADLDGFFIHLDADVLDDAVMPAVDFRVPGGLAHAELRQVLGAALATGKAVGIEITIYNPRLDESGEAGRTLVDSVVAALNGA